MASFIKRTLGLACLVAWLSMCVFRVDMLQAYGKGTGQNRVMFTLLDVTAYQAVYSARVRGHDVPVKAALTGLGIPGEVFKHAVELREFPKTSEILEDAKRWSASSKMKGIMKPKDDTVSGLLSILGLTSIVMALFSPKNASALFLLVLLGLQNTLRASEPSVKLTDNTGVYACVFAAIASVFL